MLSENKAAIANIKWEAKQISLNKTIKTDFFDKIHDCCCISILQLFFKQATREVLFMGIL